MKNLSKINWSELIRCVNPFHGYGNYESSEKYFRESRTDSLSGYPNGKALREYLRDIGMLDKGTDLAIYTVDLLGLHNFNELHGYKAGDCAIKSTLDAVNQAVSPLKGKTYREGGDEIIAVVKDIDKITAEKIPHRIIDLLNLRSSLPICNPYMDSSIKVAIGMTYAYSRENLFKHLDKSKEICSKEKAEIYSNNPELGKRKHKPIEVSQ